MPMKLWTLLALILALAIPASAQTAKLLDPNSATEAQLSAVPGLGPLTPAIMAKRPFGSPLDFDAVLATTLNPDQRTQIYLRVWVPMNLNTATVKDIMLIPGMGARMADEFREYRPYKSIGQFRYEIGKYVSKPEVARLEQYVFVPPR